MRLPGAPHKLARSTRPACTAVHASRRCKRATESAEQPAPSLRGRREHGRRGRIGRCRALQRHQIAFAFAGRRADAAARAVARAHRAVTSRADPAMEAITLPWSHTFATKTTLGAERRLAGCTTVSRGARAAASARPISKALALTRAVAWALGNAAICALPTCRASALTGGHAYAVRRATIQTIRLGAAVTLKALRAFAHARRSAVAMA